MCLLELLPPMKPRRYSISSSPLETPERLHAHGGGGGRAGLVGRGRYRGTCSSFLTRVEPGTRFKRWFREPHTPFCPPEDPGAPRDDGSGDGARAVPRVHPGAGEAGRAGREAREGAAVLWCDHPDVDFLYREELEAWQRQGVVEVYPAFFRQERDGVSSCSTGCGRSERVGELLDAGARLYVCGDGRYMAPAVRETVARISPGVHRVLGGAGHRRGCAGWRRRGVTSPTSSAGRRAGRESRMSGARGQMTDGLGGIPE